ncbi:MAG: RND transporter [Peptococcaceae bacterium BRH_c4b]|nr:MAG: RND transporter [Peptococcaceae bacterium BRH_c4b]
MKSKWKLLLIIPVVAIIALGVYRAGAKITADKDKLKLAGENNVQTVLVKEATKEKMENFIQYTGTLEAVNEASISAKVAGRVSRVAVDNGDSVAAGHGLVYLENTEYQNALNTCRAAQQKAQAGLVTARSNYNRFKELHSQGAVSDKDFEDISTALTVAEADVSSATAAVSNAEESLRNSTIASPIGGVVANRNVNVGQVLSPGVQLMTVADISSVYVVVNVEQEKISQVRPGMQAAVSMDGYPGKTFNGVVNIINPIASKSARVFETKIKISNKDRLLKPGMFAKVEIKTSGEKEVVAVPRDALTDKQGLYFVFLAGDGKAERHQVEIGQIIGQLVEIKSGLNPGQKIIVTNVNKLKDQDSIRIK